MLGPIRIKRKFLKKNIQRRAFDEQNFEKGEGGVTECK